MRRWKLVVVVVGIVAVVSATALILRPETPPAEVTPANFWRVKSGMTLDEVTFLLGPPGDYRTSKRTEYDQSAPTDQYVSFPSHAPNPDFPGVPRYCNPTRLVWFTDSGNATVTLDDSGRAFMGTYLPMRIPNDSFWDKLARKTKRLLRPWFP